MLQYFVARAKQHQAEMFPGKEILRSAVLVAIGGIVALLITKLLEGDEGAAVQTDMREIRGGDELNEAERSKKHPQENDERLCWEGECHCSHIKHTVAKSDLEYFTESFDFWEASYMSKRLCVNTEKWKMHAVKNCHAKIFYHHDGTKF